MFVQACSEGVDRCVGVHVHWGLEDMEDNFWCHIGGMLST